MTIPYLGGAGENLGPGLNAIADTIGQLINPDAKFQQAAKMLFLEKPELMQKFVDIEKANPGTLRAFGFGERGSDMLSKMQESIPGLSSRLLAPKVAEELQKPNSSLATTATSQAITGKTPGELAQDDFSGWFAKEGQKLLDSDPELFIRAARSKFGTGTKLENTQEDAALTAYNNAQSLRDLPPMQIVEEVASGKRKMNEVAGLLTGPEGAAVQMAMKLYQEDKEAKLRMTLARFGRADDPIARTKLAAAIDAWQAAKGKGSLGGWYNHLWGDNTFGAPVAGDAEIIAGALRDQQFDQRTQQLQRVTKAIEPIITAIHKGGSGIGDDEEQQQRVSRINEVLKANDSDWTAVWDQDGVFNLGKLVFQNKAGDVTDDPSALVSEIPPSNTAPGADRIASSLTPPQQALAAQLKGLVGEARKARIAQIRARATNPQVAEAIIQLGGGE